jgi:hypothetical protein
VPAKIIAKGRRVDLRNRCPTHGVREDFLCSDVRQSDRMDFIRPEPVLALGLTGYQRASLALISIFAGLWAEDRRP